MLDDAPRVTEGGVYIYIMDIMDAEHYDKLRQSFSSMKRKCKRGSTIKIYQRALSHLLQVGERKPQAGPFREAVKKAGYPSEDHVGGEWVHVGDDWATDCVGAKTMRMRTILVRVPGKPKLGETPEVSPKFLLDRGGAKCKTRGIAGVGIKT